MGIVIKLGESLREEQGAEENIWTEEGLRDSRLEKIHNGELHNLGILPPTL
jgi:hypothetical protein